MLLQMPGTATGFTTGASSFYQPGPLCFPNGAQIRLVPVPIPVAVPQQSLSQQQPAVASKPEPAAIAEAKSTETKPDAKSATETKPAETKPETPPALTPKPMSSVNKAEHAQPDALNKLLDLDTRSPEAVGKRVGELVTDFLKQRPDYTDKIEDTIKRFTQILDKDSDAFQELQYHIHRRGILPKFYRLGLRLTKGRIIDALSVVMNRRDARKLMDELLTKPNYADPFSTFNFRYA